MLCRSSVSYDGFTSRGHECARGRCILSGGFSEQFRLNGQVQNPARFRLADLQYRPSVHLTVSYFSGNQGLVTKTYEGVPLIDLLNDAVIVTDPARKNDILKKYVQVKATDCYEVIVSVAELLSTF